MDWGQVRQRAQAFRGRKVLKLGLHMADQLMGVPLPDSIAYWVCRDTAIQETAQRLMQVMMERHTGRELDYQERVRFQLSVKDGISSKIRYGLYSLTHHLWSGILKR
jgi:hypothetical protein